MPILQAKNKGSENSEAWPSITQLTLDLFTTQATLLTSTLFFRVIFRPQTGRAYKGVQVLCEIKRFLSCMGVE